MADRGLPVTASRFAESKTSSAYAWTLAFLIVFFLRPGDWIPGLAIIPLAKITGLFAVVAFVLSAGGAFSRLPREMLYLILLFGWLCVTIPFAYWRGGSFEVVFFRFSKVVLITVVVAMVATTLTRLRKLLFLQGASVAVLSALAILVRRSVHGGRLVGVLNSQESNPNEFAVSIAVAFPFCLAFLLQSRRALAKTAWTLGLIIMGCAVMLTGSRAGLLEMAVTMGVCLWEFGIKGRRRGLVLSAGVAVLAILLLTAGRLTERWKATFDPSEDQATYGSTELRRETLVQGLMVTATHPLFGVGPGNFTSLSGSWREVHNIYVQLSCEGGILALALYLLMLRKAFQSLQITKQLARGQPAILLLAQALRASLIGFAVGAFFLTETYDLYCYLLVGYGCALYQVAVAENPGQAEPSAVGHPGGRRARTVGAAPQTPPIPAAR